MLNVLIRVSLNIVNIVIIYCVNAKIQRSHVLAKRVAVTTADYWCTIYTRMTCTVDMTGGFQTCKKHAAN